MQKLLFSTRPVWQQSGLAVVRILIGLFMAYHGSEVFRREAMEPYLQWEVIQKLPAPELMLYMGKGSEFIAGMCFIFGFMTRIASLLMMGTMLFICFFIGSGKFYFEDQLSFLFAVFGAVFFLVGPSKWAIDFLLFPDKQR